MPVHTHYLWQYKIFILPIKKNYFCPMNVAPHIAQYLMLHQQVTITGLGVFTLNKKNGFFDSQGNTFYPPYNEITFEHTAVNSSHLAQYIGSQYNIEAQQAQQYIQTLANSILLELDNNRSYALENIGTLQYIDKQITLIQQEPNYFNKPFFGLQAVKIDEIKATNTPQEAKPSNTNYTATTPPEASSNNDFPLTYQLAEQALKTARYQTNYNKSESQVPWFWLFASFIVALTILIIAATLHYFPPFATNHPVKVIHQNVTIPVNTSDKKNKAIVSPPLQFEIIMRENISPTKAQGIVDNLKLKGISAHVLLDSLGKLSRVSAATLYNADSAQALLKTIQQKYYPKAYLKTIAPKK